MNAQAGRGATILFDGVCGMCNAAVRFILANDPGAHFRFAALQSEAGMNVMTLNGRDPDARASIVLIDQTGVYERSDAIVRIVRGLRAPWPALALLEAIPVALRDRVYDWVARNRYRWFARSTDCPLPTAAQRSRFL